MISNLSDYSTPPLEANPFYFEGPEKKLEVFFTAASTGEADFRQISQPVWSDVLADANCSIIHSLSNDVFDSYLLSESSFFVYPHKLIVKTCGNTTLLLMLPKLMSIAASLGISLSHVHYSHFRLALPQLQPYPHASFADEQSALASLLSGHIAAVSAQVLGEDSINPGATRWYALCADARPLAVIAPPSPSEPDVIEVAMEGLSSAVCKLFEGATFAPLAGKSLAQAMSAASGIGALVAGALVDDWAFEPVGYSMNALRDAYYYTVHITPEESFSYASFETNDPGFANDNALKAILDVFQPTTCTVTLTSRRFGAANGTASSSPHSVHPPADDFKVASSWETSRLSAHVSVSAASFVRAGVGSQAATPIVVAPEPKSVASLVMPDEELALSTADSDSTAPLDECFSEAQSSSGDEESAAAARSAMVSPCSPFGLIEVASKKVKLEGHPPTSVIEGIDA